MCGLIYSVSFKNKPVNSQTLEQYKAQRLRGHEGFGVYDGNFENLVRKTKESDIVKWLHKYKSTEILFHHRLPTSTDNVKNACHPFSTGKYFKTNYILIHNGVINNSHTLRNDHEKLKIKYHSVQKDERFNDSEALSWDVALYLEHEQEELKAYGAIAFICLAINKKGKKLYFARNSSPLYFSLSKKRLFLASQRGVAQTEVKTHTLYEFDYTTKKLKTTPMRVKAFSSDSDTYSYPTPYNSPPHNCTAPKDEDNYQYSPSKEEEEPQPEYMFEDIVNDDVHDPALADARAIELKRVFEFYLNGRRGYFWAAIRELRQDIRDLEGDRFDAINQENLDDINNEISVLRSVKDMLLIHPQYTTFNSRDSIWENDDKKLADVLGGLK